MARIEIFTAALWQPVGQAVCGEVDCVTEFPIPASPRASDLDFWG